MAENDPLPDAGPIELEPPGRPLEITPDRRRLVPEPLPVRLIAIADVRLPASAGVERDLDRLYVGQLRFERGEDREGELVYRAENFDLIFIIDEPPIEHADLTPTEIQVQSLKEVADRFIEAEFEFERQRGISPGDERLVFRDPAGNWIALSEQRRVM